MEWRSVERALLDSGLRPRGGFHPRADDGVPALADGRTTRTLVLAGALGDSLWPAFSASPEFIDGAPHPLDRWSGRVLRAVAAVLGGTAILPSDGPPYAPFVAWAQRAEPVAPSPLGLLIHPDYGLWHAYRGALLLAEPLALPARGERASPCESCVERPCLAACPVGAFTGERFEVAACAAHLDTPAGEACYRSACLARAACPVGRSYAYDEAQAVFHMTAFRLSRG
jgi:hypothetical protein